jgi:[ribosomal protein S18]-alanine N-acetyltransferase
MTRSSPAANKSPGLTSIVARNMSPALLRFVRFERTYAETILSWRYPPPYDFYNAAGLPSETEITQLLQPDLHYFAVLDEDDEMIAFRCFGPDAQVPGGDYTCEALDLGGGLRPDLTGQGLGRHVISAAMSFSLQRCHPSHFRTTVAAFNIRAIRTCEHLGYRVASTFTRPTDGLRFQIFRQQARSPTLSIPLKE